MNYKKQLFMIMIVIICNISIAMAGQSLFSKKEYQSKNLTREELNILKSRKLRAIRIYPDIVTNLRTHADQKKFHYILLRLDLVTISRSDRMFIRKNLPLIKAPLILFLNKQVRANFQTDLDKATIEQRLLLVINNALIPIKRRDVIKEVMIQKIIIEEL